MSVDNIETFHAMERGLLCDQRIEVTFLDASGERRTGSLIGVGSMLSIQSDGVLYEDIRVSSVRSVQVLTV